MPILTSPSRAVPTALIYITLGTLIEIWTIVAWIYYPPQADWTKFLIAGSMATGIALLVIGLFLGRIGRAARNAELPPPEVTPDVAAAEQEAASNPPPVVTGTTAVQNPPAGTTPIPTAAPIPPNTSVERR